MYLDMHRRREPRHSELNSISALEPRQRLYAPRFGVRLGVDRGELTPRQKRGELTEQRDRGRVACTAVGPGVEDANVLARVRRGFRFDQYKTFGVRIARSRARGGDNPCVL